MTGISGPVEGRVLTMRAAQWVECPQCEGSGGSETLDDCDPAWVDCPDCEGTEGWTEETTSEGTVG